jgi:hypothetical protein
MHRRTFLKSVLATAGAVLMGGTAYAYRSSRIEISRRKLALSGLTQEIRIIAFSDLHIPCFYSSSPDLVTRVNELRPDIFVLAGDTVDRRGREYSVGLFGAIRAKFAKVATLGNWEYLGNLDLAQLRKQYRRAEISLLVNEAIEVAELTIVGLDDFLCGCPDYQIVKLNGPSSGPILVVSHCPESFDFISAVSPNPTVTISGHTHGGQIAPFGFVLHTPEGSGSYVHGWYHKGNHSMYVSRGIGTTPGLPLRIGARPEVLILDLIDSAPS